MPSVFKTPLAMLDLIATDAYLIMHAGNAVADRFLAQVERTFFELAGQPMLGSQLSFKRHDLPGMRTRISKHS